MDVRSAAAFGICMGALLWGESGYATDIKVILPEDKTVVKGEVQFQLLPVISPGERHFADPDLSIRDDAGRPLTVLAAPRDPVSRTCKTTWDTRKLPDGLYFITVTYRNLVGGGASKPVEKELTLSVRNSGLRPQTVLVEAPAQAKADDDGAPLRIVVRDQRARSMPGARVAVTTTGGELDTTTDLTNLEGEVLATLTSDAPRDVTVTVQVESLPAVKKLIRFVP